MARIYHYSIPVLISACGSETEIIAEIDYTIIRGCPATGPSYASGGEPATPAEIELTTVEITVPTPKVLGGVITIPAPEWMERFLANDSVYCELGDAADWGEERPDPDAAYDAKRDDAMMERNQ